MYVYIKSESNLWTVGFYDPQGKWHSESDHNSPDKAAGRIAWLNGGKMPQTIGPPGFRREPDGSIAFYD
jgi:hypothetical protein